MSAPGNREDIGYWLNGLGLVGDGAEVGTHKGIFAAHLLSTWKGRLLVCVDAWAPVEFDRELYEEEPTKERQEQAMFAAEKRLSVFGERAQIIRSDSVSASNLFEDCRFDFVYIDAAHDYASVFADLAAWWPKVRPGGIFCGDDYSSRQYPGVSRAVNEFSKENQRPLLATTLGAGREQWYIKKP